MGDLFSSVSNRQLNDTYVVEDELGEGAFGKVYKVRFKGTNNIFALKVIKCDSNEAVQNVLREMRVIGKLDHPNIMKLFETKCVQPNPFTAELHLVFEFLSGGTLNQRLVAHANCKTKNLKWMRQLADGVAYLHSCNLVHRDLKPDNILFNANEDIKIGDFGLARDFPVQATNQSLESYYMLYGCGTLFYIAPEVFFDHYTEKADVFALGILFYAIEERTSVTVGGDQHFGMFFRSSLDGSITPLGLKMYLQRNGQVTIPFNNTSKELARIIGSVLLFDQKQRPSASNIQQKLNDYKI